MKKWAIYVCFLVLLASCNSILSSKPSGTLSENKMIDVLVDIHLTEATLKMVDDSNGRVSDTSELRTRFAQVFSRNDISPDDFNASLTYYLKHIDEFDKIYVEVINRLTALEATLQSVTPPANTERNRMNNSRLYPLNNIWYKMMNSENKPPEIQYFDAIKYPVTSHENFIILKQVN